MERKAANLSLHDRLNVLLDRIEKLLVAAENAAFSDAATAKDRAVAWSGYRELCRVLEILGRLTGQLQHGSQTNVQVNVANLGPGAIGKETASGAGPHEEIVLAESAAHELAELIINGSLVPPVELIRAVASFVQTQSSALPSLQIASFSNGEQHV